MNSTKPSLRNFNSRKLYWTCQLIGWGAVSVYWAYTVYSRDHYGAFYTFVNYVLDIAIGIFLTHIYRALALRLGWNDRPIGSLLKVVVPSIVVLALLYVLLNNIKWYLYWTYIGGRDVDLYKALVYWDPILLTGLRLMSIWLLAYHLFHYYQKELATAKENARLSVLTKQIQLDNLSAQLNPHFLFNSLNSIKSLVEEDPHKARRAVDLLSDLLRSSLYGKQEDLISLKEELALVEDYIELEKLRFEERLCLEMVLDSGLESVKIPCLSLQLLVENAIKHGIDKSVKGGIIKVSIHRQAETLHLSVLSPGKINREDSQGVGLQNLKERLALQYKSKAQFSLTEVSKQQVEAQLIIPIEAHENL